MTDRPKSNRPVLSRNTPYETARLCIASLDDGNRRCFKRGKFWIELPDDRGSQRWVEVEKEEIRTVIYEFLSRSDCDYGNGLVDPFDPKKRDVDQVLDACKAVVFDLAGVMDDGKG